MLLAFQSTTPILFTFAFGFLTPSLLFATLPFSSQLEPADPDFYKIDYVRSMRAYGIEFKEGPDGFGVYASKDVEPLRRARVCFYLPTLLYLSHSSHFDKSK